MNRGCAAALAFILGWMAGAPLECAGWQTSPQGRQNCCARTNHECPDKAKADDCCSRSAERQQDRSSVPPFVLLVPAAQVSVASAFIPKTSDTASTDAFEARFDSRPQRPTYLLIEALLI